MKPLQPRAEPILRKTAVGFSLILFLSWATEIIHLPHLLYGEAAAFNWTRALLRTAVILGVWAWVHLTTKKLLKRLHRLEEYVLICSWCRKVGHEGGWVTMEEYFGSNFDTETSHGICQECAELQLAKHITVTRVSPKKSQT
jgi:hypothetical protein